MAQAANAHPRNNVGIIILALDPGHSTVRGRAPVGAAWYLEMDEMEEHEEHMLVEESNPDAAKAHVKFGNSIKKNQLDQ